MTPKHHSHLSRKVGSTSLALALTLGASAAGATPSSTYSQLQSFVPNVSTTSPASPSPTSMTNTESPLPSTFADDTKSSREEAEEPSQTVSPTDAHQGTPETTETTAPAKHDQPTPSPDISATSDASSTTTPPAPTQEPTANPTEEPIDLKIEANSAVRPGELFNVQVTNIPPTYQVSVRLLPPAEVSDEPIECGLESEEGTTEEGTTNVTCTITDQQTPGKYTLEVKLLDEDGAPILRNGVEVVDTSRSVYIADVPSNYNPQVLVQYPVTASGYVMPVVGEGYAPDSEISLNALGANGQPVPGITFVVGSDRNLPTVADMDAAQTSLKVKTDSQGMFRAYIITSPYMGSSSVEIMARDEQNNFFAADTLSILGESVAELTPSPSSFVAGEINDLNLSGNKFAPYYKSYPVQLLLKHNGRIVSHGIIDLEPPTNGELWSSFDDVELTGLSALEAGDYQIQAFVPDIPDVPTDFKGRLLASTQFSVTSPAAQPSVSANPVKPDPTDVPVPLPTDDAEPVPTHTALPTPLPSDEAEPIPAPTESIPAEEPSFTPTPGDVETTEVATEATERVPTNSAPQEPAAQAPEPSAQPIFEQRQRTEATPSALEQNPAWLQSSSIRPEDPRLEREPNQELKSSVLNAQGTKEAEARFDPNAGLNDALTSTDSADLSSAVVNLNSSRPWWPIGLLILAALTVGALTGATIVKSTRESKHRA